MPSFQLTSPIPNIIKAVYDWAEDHYDTDNGVFVSIGYKAPNDATPLQVMVGVDDPVSGAAASSGDESQQMASAGLRDRDGTGSINIALSAWNGESDDLAQWWAIQSAYELMADLEDWLRANTDLAIRDTNGDLLFRQLVCEVGSHRLYVNETDSGADALIVLALNFTTRI